MDSTDRKHSDYQSKVNKIIAYLEHGTTDLGMLEEVQVKLDRLAVHYQDDDKLGSERYKLYQAQAMLSYRLGDVAKSRQFIEGAIAVRGESYELAEQLLEHLGHRGEPMPVTKWFIPIVLPIPLLALAALMQLATHFAATKADGGSPASTLTLANLASILAGVAALAMLLLLPLWIIKIMRAKRANEINGYALSKAAAVVLAVLAGFWTWLYTYERNKGRFWFGLVLTLTGYGGILVWLWAIIDNAIKPDSYYSNYPN